MYDQMNGPFKHLWSNDEFILSRNFWVYQSKSVKEINLSLDHMCLNRLVIWSKVYKIIGMRFWLLFWLQVYEGMTDPTKPFRMNNLWIIAVEYFVLYCLPTLWKRQDTRWNPHSWLPESLYSLASLKTTEIPRAYY